MISMSHYSDAKAAPEPEPEPAPPTPPNEGGEEGEGIF
jgi:hypothetical protein